MSIFKKASAVCCMALLMLSAVAIPVVAQTPEEPTVLGSGSANVDSLMYQRRPGSVYESVAGGTWEYGVDHITGNASTVFSYLLTARNKNHTSVQPGTFAAVSTSGWKPVGTRAMVSRDASLLGGNRAFYDFA